VIAITDHDEIAGSLQARELAERHGIEVVTGAEVSSSDGHVLALYVDQRISPGRSLAETLRMVGELGGLCLAPHPTAWRTPSLSAQVIRQALADPDLARVLVGIEVWNGGLIRSGSNRRAQALASQLSVARVGSSDAHLTWSIGFAVTRFAGSTASDLRRALEQHETEAILRYQTAGAHFLARWAARKASLALRRSLSAMRPSAPRTARV
jgi:predicted metal-dependent phosphoesterase TrpH